MLPAKLINHYAVEANQLMLPKVSSYMPVEEVLATEWFPNAEESHNFLMDTYDFACHTNMELYEKYD